MTIQRLNCRFHQIIINKGDNSAGSAEYEPNAAAGKDDINLAGAAARAARTGSVFEGSDQGAASTAFPPPWPGLGLNLLGPTFRAETEHGAAAPTGPPLREEEEAGEEEPEDPSTELLRSVGWKS